jgi:hypothetical protein
MSLFLPDSSYCKFVTVLYMLVQRVFESKSFYLLSGEVVLLEDIKPPVVYKRFERFSGYKKFNLYLRALGDAD